MILMQNLLFFSLSLFVLRCADSLKNKKGFKTYVCLAFLYPPHTFLLTHITPTHTQPYTHTYFHTKYTLQKSSSAGQTYFKVKNFLKAAWYKIIKLLLLLLKKIINIFRFFSNFRSILYLFIIGYKISMNSSDLYNFEK